jgi:formate hydrogenlyase subunit 3/multisubunit Na+/H+ antiporter MnhD subunit
VFVGGCLVLGVGGSQVILQFASDADAGRAEFLVFWGLMILGMCLWMLLVMRMGDGFFRGAVVFPRRPGESQEEADARGDNRAWRVHVPLVATAGLLCYAFIIWQALEHF